jgi:N-acyl-D-aspartate/D-glutamate deacylase
MAHYNFPLRLLKLVRDAEQRGEPFMTMERAVQRLTSEIAEWLGLDAGVLETGRRADVVVVDPQGLDDALDEIHEAPMPGFDLQRLVRRNDRAVRSVLIAGRIAAHNGQTVDELGRRPGYGAVLRAGEPAPLRPPTRQRAA